METRRRAGERGAACRCAAAPVHVAPEAGAAVRRAGARRCAAGASLALNATVGTPPLRRGWLPCVCKHSHLPPPPLSAAAAAAARLRLHRRERQRGGARHVRGAGPLARPPCSGRGGAVRESPPLPPRRTRSQPRPLPSRKPRAARAGGGGVNGIPVVGTRDCRVAVPWACHNVQPGPVPAAPRCWQHSLRSSARCTALPTCGRACGEVPAAARGQAVGTLLMAPVRAGCQCVRRLDCEAPRAALAASVPVTACPAAVPAARRR